MGLFNEPTPDRHCRQCEHWAGDIADGLHILCMYQDRPYVQATPERGCVHWVRATGANDEQKTPRRV